MGNSVIHFCLTHFDSWCILYSLTSGIPGADVFLLPPRLTKSTPANSMLYSWGSSSCWRPLGMAQSSAPPLLQHYWRSVWGWPRVLLQPPTPWQCCRPRLTPLALIHVRPRNPSSESFCPINRGRWWVFSRSVSGSANSLKIAPWARTSVQLIAKKLWARILMME